LKGLFLALAWGLVTLPRTFRLRCRVRGRLERVVVAVADVVLERASGEAHPEVTQPDVVAPDHGLHFAHRAASSRVTKPGGREELSTVCSLGAASFARAEELARGSVCGGEMKRLSARRAATL
jgi:hypothetical protein